MWQVARVKNGNSKEGLRQDLPGRGPAASAVTHLQPSLKVQPAPNHQPTLHPKTQTTYVKKGMGCTNFRSGSFSRMVSACLFFRSPRASPMMACVSAALTDTSWIDMSLTVCKTRRNYNATN